MSDDILIKANSLYRYYGTRCVLNDVSFTAKKGEITGFLGPNGAGKSTLMQILCGVLAPTSGAVSIAGHDILEHPFDAKSILGYLPEQPPLYLDCTVDEFLTYCAKLRGISNQDITDRLDIVKNKCGLSDVGKRVIANLSKGYQQRTGVAQAIIHSPDVVVLDEPSSGLDPKQIIELRDLIVDMGKDHCVILSTHILAEAQSLCDRILILNMGKIALDKKLSLLTNETDSLEDIYVQLTQQAQNAKTENTNDI